MLDYNYDHNGLGRENYSGLFMLIVTTVFTDNY